MITPENLVRHALIGPACLVDRSPVPDGTPSPRAPDSLLALALEAIPLPYRDPFLQAFQGGKRVRPLLMEQACASLKKPFAPLLPAAVAVELFHCATLLHDDLVDGDRVRRGRAAFHVQASPRAAVLYGDFFAVRAIQLVQEQLPALLPAFLEATAAVAEGQLLEFHPLAGWDDYLRYAELKTASLFRFAAAAPFLLAGQPAEAWDQVGRRVGIAFQLANDLRKEGESHSVLQVLPRGQAEALLSEHVRALAGVLGTDFMARAGLASPQLLTRLRPPPPDAGAGSP